MRSPSKRSVKAAIKTSPEYKAFLKELAAMAEAKLDELVTKQVASQMITERQKRDKVDSATRAIKPAKRHTIVVQEWEESERGWGCRPDGASLHLNEADRVSYCKDYWDREKQRNPSGIAPDEYSRESGSPVLMDVDAKTFNDIKKSKNGIMMWQSEYSSLRQKMGKR